MEAIQLVDTMEYDQDFQKVAGWLARGDRFLAEELRSEMHIAISNMPYGYARAFYVRAAKCKAIDWLRSRSRHYSYDNAIKHISLQSIRTAGYQIDTDGNVYTPERDNTIDIEE